MSANSTLEYAFAPSAVAGTEAALLPAPSRVAEALSDLMAGFTRAWMWSALAYQDIKLRYRGSLL